MTKSIVLIIYIIVALVTAVFAFHAYHRKETIAHTLGEVLMIAAINCFCYSITLTTDDYFIVSFAYTLVFISTICLIYFLNQYAIQYTNIGHYSKYTEIILKWVILLDITILLINPFYELALTYKSVVYNGEQFLSMVPFLLFDFHLALSYIGVFFFVCLFVKKIMITAGIYRRKYIGILIGVLLIVFINGIFVFYSLIYDVSILGFALMASLIYYFTFFYFPKSFIDRVNNVIITHTDSPVFMFDASHQCIYRNNEALHQFPYFDIKKKHTLESISKKLKIDQHLKMDEKIIFEAHFKNNEDEKDYIITFNQLYDNKNRYVGCSLIMQDTTDKNKLLQQLHNLAYFDPLTGIYNNTLFNQTASQFLKNHKDKKCLLIKFDIQRFKHINEVLGKKVGDNILCAIADGFKRYLPKECVYGRAETDHFTICIESDQPVLTYIQQIFDHIKDTLNLAISIIPSIGIYEVEDVNITVSQMCDWANLASHTIKGNYLRQHAYYKKDMSQEVFKEQEIINDLQDALNNDCFDIYIQPQYHHQTKKIVGGEVLVRWIHPQKGVIPATTFIPIFEKNGFIARLDEFVWEKTCRYLKKWIDENSEIANIPLSINISRADFYYIDVEEKLIELTSKYNIPRNKLALEITESAYTDDSKDMIDMVKRLQNHGFIVEMDDFGSGYSSLALLKDLPVNIIKLDMNFLSYKNEADQETSHKIIKGVIKMIQSLSIPIIVEGVETMEQADFVSSLGCHTIQGYYYAKPIPVSEYLELVTK